MNKMVSDESYTEIILKNEEYFSALLNDIEKAQHTIDFEVYIFNNDNAGKQLAQAFCEAAKRGVKIRVLVDGIGTPEWGNEISDSLENVGIETKVYHALPWITPHWRRSNKSVAWPTLFFKLLAKINSRNHRKLCIIDHRIVYVGSANITDHLLPSPEKANVWRETSVKLIDIQTDSLQYAFEKAWGGVPFKTRLRAAFIKLRPEPIFWLNYSMRLRRIIYHSLLRRIAACQQRIWVANAYFIPDGRLLRRLMNARARGIDVRILVPSQSDVFIASIATKTFYYTLLKADVLIYEYLPSVLHEKILILDEWYLVGSSNLNYRSIKHDLEVDVNIRTPEAQKELESQYQEDLLHAKKIELADVSKQSVFQYLLGRLILSIRFWG